MQPVSLRLSPAALETLSALCHLTGETQSVFLARLIEEAKLEDVKRAFPQDQIKPTCYYIPDGVDTKLKKMAARLDCTQISILELLVSQANDEQQ